LNRISETGRKRKKDKKLKMFVPVAKILKRYKVFYLLFYSVILSGMVLYHKSLVSVDLGSVSYNFDISIVVQYSMVNDLSGPPV
jgi:hypothetical protein